ncbi:hypothetical protein FOZ62_025505 [Perkinsus olseni]|uniref:Uncharacterized protein n=1 Tax=Perkinsus olseni TaxID=32597 RepID=A0A7J6N791_PEROL|nr:hypothetical protein FOZ62_025505 [Perkinsus olseni]
MFSGPIYYHRTHGDGSHPFHGGYGADHLQEEETLSSQYSMKYGWSIIDDVKISTFIGHTLSGSRTGTICVNTAEPRTMLFEGRRFGIGPEDYVRVVVGRFDACAADYLPAVLSRTRYSDRRSTIINVPSHTETADLCRIITWAKLSMGNNYNPAEEEEGSDDISGGAAEVADEIYNAASEWLSSWFEKYGGPSSPAATSSTASSSHVKHGTTVGKRTASADSTASTTACTGISDDCAAVRSPSTAEAADSKITKGPARSNTGRLRNLMDTLTDISIHDATPRREVDGGDVESVPGFELENTPVTKTSQDDGAGDISPSWHGSDSGGNSPKALPIFVIEEPTDEASADYGVAEEDASPVSTTASEPRTPRKTIHLGPAEGSGPSVDPREETHMLALKAGKSLHMGLSLYR